MERRSVVVVVLLTLITFGLYGLWWMWKTTADLRDLTGRDDLRPGLDLLMTIVTLGVWRIWVGYRNAEVVHQAMDRRGEMHDDRSLPILGFGLLTWLTGLSWLVVTALLQGDYNRLADATMLDPIVPPDDSDFLDPLEDTSAFDALALLESKAGMNPLAAVETDPVPLPPPMSHRPNPRPSRGPTSPVDEFPTAGVPIPSVW